MRSRCLFIDLLDCYWLASITSFVHMQESVVEIQYIKRGAGPEPGESLLHDDWVSAVHSIDNLYVFVPYFYNCN